MQFSIKSGDPSRIRTNCVVVGVFESHKLSAAGAVLDRAARGYLSALIKHGNHDGKSGTMLLLPRVPQLTSQRVLLIGLGRELDFGDRQFREAVSGAVRMLDRHGIEDAVLCLSTTSKGRDLAWRVTQATLLASDVTYRFDCMKSKPERLSSLRKLTFLVERSDTVRATKMLKRGIAIAHVGMSQLFRIGSESSLPLPNSSVEELVRGAVRKLQSNEKVAERLREARLDRNAYFARLFELAKGIGAESSAMGGFSPRTVAAGSVYLANLRMGAKMVRQREAAETLGMAEFTIREFCIRTRKQSDTR